jgi:Putative addiction module component
MTVVAKKILDDAMKLPLEVRAEIVGELLRSLDEDDRPGEEPLGDTVARRLREIDDGSVTALSWDEAERLIDSDEPSR